MGRLHEHFPGLRMEQHSLGSTPTPVRRLSRELVGDQEVWVKDESAFGSGGWGGNKVRKLEWILPEAARRGTRTLFTVGGIGTHWGLAAALYGRELGLRTVLGLVDQPVDDHVRAQLARLRGSGAELHRFADPSRLRLAAPLLMARAAVRDRRWPWYLPAGGSNPFGTVAYVEAAYEIAEQVAAGDLPVPATVVAAVGSGGTAAGLALGLRLSGLPSRLFGVVVNDSFPLTAEVIAGLANRTRTLLESRGAGSMGPEISPQQLDLRADWLGATYGDPTPPSVEAVQAARAVEGMDLEPVYTGKALAAVREARLPEPVLWLNTHGPR